MGEEKSLECAAFGASVRELRQELGLSQDDFAATAGVHRTYIGGVERGERNPTLTSIFKIAAGLKVSPADLLAMSSARLRTRSPK